MRVIALAMALAVSACATVTPEQTQIDGHTSGGDFRIYASERNLPAWAYDPSTAQLDFVVRLVDDEELKTILADMDSIETSCRMYADEVTPSRLVGILSHFGLYFTAGFVGTGTAADIAFDHIDVDAYRRYGGISSGAQGAAYSVITATGEEIIFANCGAQIADLFPHLRGKVRVLQRGTYY